MAPRPRAALVLPRGSCRPYPECMASDPPSKFAGPVTLVGATVRLVPLSIVHAEALVEAAGEDRSNYQWTPVPGGLGAMRAYIERAVGLAECGEATAVAPAKVATGL